MAEDDLQEILPNYAQQPLAPAISPSLHTSNSLPVMPSHIPPSLVMPAPTPRRAHVRIVEQPTNKTIRFRYKCEGRTAGSIPGLHSTADNKTFPTIEIVDFDGPAYVVVSCVTSKEPYRQHPHVLVSKEEPNNCRHGVYIKELAPDERRLELQKFGIQCVKKMDVRESLLCREKRNIDPFNARFDHKDDVNSINLYELRLCYQVFVKMPSGGNTPLDPVVSTPIYGKSNELTISRLCSCSSPMNGGAKVILLCEKVTKGDIKVRFFETDEAGNEIWEAFAEFQPMDIHKQFAIAFTTPRYRNPDIQHCVKVKIELVRPSDQATSAPRNFEYYPNPETMAKKFRSDATATKRRFSDIMQQFQSNPSKVEPSLAEFFDFTGFVPVDNNNKQRTSPTGTYVPDIKAELDVPRNCPSAASSINYAFPHSPSSTCSTDSYVPLNMFQQQQPSNRLQPPLNINQQSLDVNPSCSRVTLQQQQANPAMDFVQSNQQANLMNQQEQLVQRTSELNITNGNNNNNYNWNTTFNGGEVIIYNNNNNNNNNINGLTINNQMNISTINNNNMFSLNTNEGTSPAYQQSASPVQFQQQQQQQQQQCQQQQQLQQLQQLQQYQQQQQPQQMNIGNNNLCSLNMNGSNSPAYEQSPAAQLQLFQQDTEPTFSLSDLINEGFGVM